MRYLPAYTFFMFFISLASAHAYSGDDIEKAREFYKTQSYQYVVQQLSDYMDEEAASQELEDEVTLMWSHSILKLKTKPKSRDAEINLLTLINADRKDRWWALGNEALADYYQEVDQYNKNQEIRYYYNNAREYWAGSSDLDEARPKFIDLSFRLADFITSRWGWYHEEVAPIAIPRSSVLPTPVEIVPPEPPKKDKADSLSDLYREILKVAKDDNDKAKAYYGLGMSKINDYRKEDNKNEGIKTLQKLVTDFPQSEWTDDALYQMGIAYEQVQDFVSARNAYATIGKNYKPGESKWRDDAERRYQNIIRPELNIHAGMAFVPDSLVTFSTSWKNVSGAKFTLYKFDIAEYFEAKNNKFKRPLSNFHDALNALTNNSSAYKNLPVVSSWNVELQNDGKHIRRSENKTLAHWKAGAKPNEIKNIELDTGKLPRGAYLLAAEAKDVKGFTILIVSDITLVSKLSEDKAILLAMDAKTGTPLSGTKLEYAYTYQDKNNHQKWIDGAGVTNNHGILEVALKDHLRDDNYSNRNISAIAVSDKNAPAMVQTNYYWNAFRPHGDWSFYAYADRPAYRPNETISFKGVVRKPEDGSYTNPAGMSVKAVINNPQGQKVYEETLTLNEFGSFAGEFKLDDKAVLGAYNINITSVQGNRYLSNAQLFRLEEYKLPEFMVNVTPKPKEVKEGEISAYRLGDTVTVDIDSKYYFGGAVANADVEYLVYQQNYTHYYQPPRPYSWYYEDIYRRPYSYGHGQLMEQKTIKTDENGKASFTIETPKDSDYDLKYHIEVRVTDQSRREITGSADIKVTKNAYFAYLEAQESIYRPGDKAKIDIKTMTANDKPVPVEGKITVLRTWWREPVIQNGAIIKAAHYEGEELFTKFVRTNEKGEAVFEYEPDKNGYYEIRYTGFDNGNEVISSTYVFICEPSAVNIGYRYNGLQIITEKDTYMPGDKAQAMIVTDKPGTWVLFSQESDVLHDYQMIEMKGTVKLVEFEVKENYTPNIYLNALSGDEYQLKQTNMQLIVPPDDKFLNVKVISDKDVYEPQEEGKYIIEVTDKDGKPVPKTEVSLGLTDASVYYIQPELAQDIRQYFYGNKRGNNVRTQASLYMFRFVDYVIDENGNLMTRAQKDQRRAQQLLRQDKNAPTDGNELHRWRRLQEERTVVGQSAPAYRGAVEEANEADLEMALASGDSAIPTPISAPMESKMAMNDAVGGAGGQQQADEPRVRDDFRSTVIWQPAIVTDKNGRATLTVTFPDSLTTWRATARALTKDTSVGTITHEVQSNMDLMVRLQAPRFFTERDLVAVSALIDNMTDKSLTVMPKIEAEGLVVTGLYKDGQFVKGEQGTIEIPAKGQSRVDWAVSAQEAGLAKITVTAKAQGKNAKADLSDAMVKAYPVIPHGIEKFLADAAVLKGDGNEQVTELVIDIPKERIKDSTSLQINIAPSMAAGLLDALPYLADYPYGCVEQTMSRFLPAVVVRKTMRDLGIADKDIAAYMSDVLAPRNDPEGHPTKRTDATYEKLDDMVAKGLNRLYDFQHSDGGWGWWKDGPSDRYMTSYVLWGLILSKESGIEIKNDVIARAVRFLQTQLVEEEDNPDMLAWMLHALAQADSKSKFENKYRMSVWENRDELNPYSRALFALSEHKRGDNEQIIKILTENLLNGISEDKDNATAHWGNNDGFYYRWSDGPIESTAFVIKALSNIKPDSEVLDPAVKWMSLNRRGARWSNTKDTALAILGLADYLKASQELAPDYTFEVLVNGVKIREGKVDSSNIFSFDRTIDVPLENIKDGKNNVKIVMKGKGALYASTYAKFFTLEEPITKAGNEVFVERKYYIQSVKETLMKGVAQDWKPLKDGDTVNSGDRIRVDIHLESKNNYEYLVSEDYKPAGLEAVELQSGSGNYITLDHNGKENAYGGYLYQEFRDEKAAFFISSLPQGNHIVRYELRAEVPGTFHAMPNQTHAMYVPEIRANSNEMRITVGERKGEE